MSQAIAAGVGGMIGAIIGNIISGKAVTITTPEGVPVARVLIEPWDFLGVSVMKISKAQGAQQLSVSGNIKSILLKADPNNTGRVWLGGPDVTIGNGYPLDGNSTISMQIRNFTDIYLLADSDLEQTVYIVKVGEKT